MHLDGQDDQRRRPPKTRRFGILRKKRRGDEAAFCGHPRSDRKYRRDRAKVQFEICLRREGLRADAAEF